MVHINYPFLTGITKLVRVGLVNIFLSLLFVCLADMLYIIQITILFVCRLLLQNKELKSQLEEMQTGFVKVVRTLHTINVIGKIYVSHNLRQTTRCSWLVISRHTSITTSQQTAADEVGQTIYRRCDCC